MLVALAFAGSQAQAATPVAFDDFVYRGDDAAFATPLAKGQYRNPVLSGFYPDPAVTRVGDRYYLVNSTFAYFPGIPVFESEDLVHWRLLGHAIDRPGQLDFSGLGTSRGVFAPSIAHHGDTFYIFNTAVDNGGNFYVTAKDPAGPWSDPVWLKEVDGIDPSLFIDDDGKAYLLNNGPPEGTPRYAGHRAIWLQAFDLATGQPTGPRKVLLDGGVEPAKNPIWIEGPHIYRRDGWYYLSCAEGGTGPEHSQVVLRARSPWGPFEPYAHNPILTQRDLPADRPHPIANAGHADLVEGRDGRWWAVFLASRIYGEGHYQTGRETFLLPVEWRDGWPVILDAGQAIPQVANGPSWQRGDATQATRSGNFTWRDDFGAKTLDPEWISLRAAPAWADLRSQPGVLLISPRADGLEGHGLPAFLGRRQQHQRFEAQVRVQPPGEQGVTAGLALYQDEAHWYVLGVQRTARGLEVFVQKQTPEGRQVVAHRSIPAGAALHLRIQADAGLGDFAFDTGAGWQPLREREDIHVLSTDLAGGFVGVTVGPYARAEAAPFQED
ncbi:glycoside hydrolase family 43 protein [Stenotrophomonas sp. HITSZ_GD]|uniref:glycoside hydrolase family 43 protein n=1 Tax=Stenotrophomonas sp. HITSZ_GD TaxID=3037248 RepID=UPI00240D8618|nr:glycoside hydrolase family 43 protein [Stenotrophomonas sp. HITSZ_GD]MDG2524282.1 glycoside hydrolase family 43 protein [Stenotrophomonas sp. HITSZ_GD]